MVKHCVLLKFGPDADPVAIEACFAELAALGSTIRGLLDFHGGANTSPEGLNRGYTHGFVMTFETAEARDAYLPHPDHQAAAGKLVALTEGGVEGILVLDFEA
ncbi:MAG TPA: Dabb family protein [Armatimonadota bacterium]|nr:Dabb family protein [Armatimonadota bacterium]